MRPEYERVTVHPMLLSRAGLMLVQRKDLEPAEHFEMIFEQIPRQTSDPYEQRRLLTAYAFQQPPHSTPGTRSEYSNAGWSILGHLIERVEGVTYEEVIAQRIFAKLGMTGAHIGGWPATAEDP